MLTSAQMQTLATHIRANTDPGVIAALAVRNDEFLRDWYNSDSTFVVWRSVLTPEMARNAVMNSDGLAQLDNLTVGKRDSLLWSFSGNTDPANATQRAAIEGLCGTQNALKAAILAAQKRLATKAEELFASGTGTSGSPGTLGYEGPLFTNDVSYALNA